MKSGWKNEEAKREPKNLAALVAIVDSLVSSEPQAEKFQT